jgi:hypothetical protein
MVTGVRQIHIDKVENKIEEEEKRDETNRETRKR